MLSKSWLVIKDDSKRTFEVCGQSSNDNSFVNKTYAMQKMGMNVSSITLPITNKNSSKTLVKITGYMQEDGLYERLLKEYTELMKHSFFDDEEDN